jgi:hypothetical protein
MIMMGETKVIWGAKKKKACPTASSSTINSVQTGLKLKTDLCCDRRESRNVQYFSNKIFKMENQ